MTKEELIERLEEIIDTAGDAEIDHVDADKLLLEFIGDERVSAAFEAIEKWYG